MCVLVTVSIIVVPVCTVSSPRMRLCSSVSDAEVERAKNVFRTSMFMNLDGSTAICEDIGRSVNLYVHTCSRYCV